MSSSVFHVASSWNTLLLSGIAGIDGVCVSCAKQYFVGGVLNGLPMSTTLVLTGWRQEPRHGRGDNTARVTFLVEPDDWVTEIRGDPWNMTEATSSIPA
jgi:hypothetical protein